MISVVERNSSRSRASNASMVSLPIPLSPKIVSTTIAPAIGAHVVKAVCGKPMLVIVVTEESDERHARPDYRDGIESDEHRSAADVGQLSAMTGGVDSGKNRDQIGDGN